ncbi:MAG: hypothetical protein DI585_02195 [Pseudomonas fluorescens]|nr:MAG: hypothetical protein DI585_02195 [Pseudomonas fluorescens]
MALYEDHIPEGGAGRTLVCLTGVNSGAYLMQGVIPVMGGDWQILRLNTSGVNGVPLPLPFSVKAYARQALETIDRAGVKDFVLLGHSLGGYAAQEIARMVPGRVQKLILVSTSRGQPDTAIDIAMMQKNIGMNFWEFQKLIGSNMAKGYEVLFGPGFAQQEPEIFQAFLELRRAHSVVQSVSLAQLSAGGLFSSMGWAKKLTVPTLVIHGNADNLVSCASGKKLAQTLPHAQWLELYNVGHFPMLEYAPFWDKVRQFAEGDGMGEAVKSKESFWTKMMRGWTMHG